MQRISPATSDARRGTTLAELTVILFILVLITSAIVPRVIAYQRSQNVKSLEAKLARLPLEARNEASSQQIPVTLRVNGNTIIMEELPADGSAPTEVKTIDLGTDIDVDSVQLNGQPSDTGSWVWTVYPDGSADKGAMQFAEGSAHYSLVMLPDGSTQWTDGEMPDQSQYQWQAGVLQQRSS